MGYHSQREHANDGMPGGIHTHAYATTANLFASALSLSMCVCRSIPSEPSAVFHRHDVISRAPLRFTAQEARALGFNGYNARISVTYNNNIYRL